MRYTLAALAVCLLAVPALAKPKNEIVVPLKTSSGEDAGTATFQQEKGKLSIKLNLKNLPVGEHAVHIHAKPLCDPPDFKTAAGHRARRSTGLWIAPHYWFVLGLTRDLPDDERLCGDEPSVGDAVPLRLHRELWIDASGTPCRRSSPAAKSEGATTTVDRSQNCRTNTR